MNHPRISELLIETKVFQDLDKPVILTSGALGIYYINTEKLVQDNGEWEKFGDDSQAMIAHAVKMAEQHSTFGEVIDILAERVKEIIAGTNTFNTPLISGGQRRDWLFSGPVAAKLKVAHVSLYKDGRAELFLPSYGEKDILDKPGSLAGTQPIHIVDLITEASSCYTIDTNGREMGWIPIIRNRGGKINNLIAVVSRLQGGEEMLANLNPPIKTIAEVVIDSAFLEEHSRFPTRALAYQRDPEAWTRKYLAQNGALSLLPFFDPQGSKLDRTKKFMSRYGEVLRESGKLVELEDAVQSAYEMPLSLILHPQQDS